MTLTCENETNYQVDLEGLKAEAEFLFGALQLHPETELAITLISTADMEELHLEWMQEPGATDILSFPMDELRPSMDPQPGMLGDIVICPEFVEYDTQRPGMSLSQRLEFLLVHGMLHLIGYDHATEDEYDVMFAFQDELLVQWQGARGVVGGERG
ncbi:MAG: rRNA maturation RNase YbeY [Actinomycetota bacterium]|nr:rRNA maturation RNase YbeY [Actinomycetota bacterium]